MRHVILLGHGSPDARAGAAAGALAERVSWELDAPVSCAFLDNGVALGEIVQSIEASGATSAVVVPLFLTSAFHVNVDVPEAVEQARLLTTMPLHLTPHLGIDDSVIRALDALLPKGPVVVAVAGTRDAGAQRELDELASRWAVERGSSVVVGHAAMGPKSVDEALQEAEAGSEARAAVVALVLFPGVLPDRIGAAAGSRFVTAPIAELVETVQAIVGRVRDINATAKAGTGA
jgi:sirohydrochlorin ferrochelatase